MKFFSLPTGLYLAGISCAGIAVLYSVIGDLNVENPWLLIVLCLLASLGLILKVDGPTNQSHYTFSLLVYGFTIATLGLSAAILVILVSHVMEWIWSTPPWPIQLFNVMAYLVAAQVGGLVDFIGPREGAVVKPPALCSIARLSATYCKGTLRSPSSLRPSPDAILSILIRAVLAEVKSASRRTRVGEIARAVESTRTTQAEREAMMERLPVKVAFLF